MKKTILTFLLVIFYTTTIFCQDILTNKDGRELTVKVLEISATEIKYKSFDNLEGPTYVVNKSEVLFVKYANGTKELFENTSSNTEVKKTVPTVDTLPKILTASLPDMYNQGELDASKHYYKYQGAASGTLIASIISPVIGLIPAIACASTSPKNENLNYPSTELMKNQEYYRGYTEKAKKIKVNKVWKGWGFGLAFNVVFYLLFLNK